MYARLIHWAFDRFYREFAWTYDTVAALVSWGRWRRWTLAALPALAGDILEMGCGTGNLQAALGASSFDSAPHAGVIRSVIGIDASPQMLRLAHHKAPAAVLARADARILPFASDSFDCVVATFPSEYIAASQTVAEVRRVLRPGGKLLIILGAQISGPAVYQQFVALAYHLLLLSPPATQRPAGSATILLEAIEHAGMAASDAWVAADGGWVYLITATVV